MTKNHGIGRKMTGYPRKPCKEVILSLGSLNGEIQKDSHPPFTLQQGVAFRT